MTALVVPGRFSGPPGSANGGYVAGLLAHRVDAEAAVTVRLQRPPPLDLPLAVRRDGSTVELLDGDDLLARAAPATLDLAVPTAPGRTEAAAAVAARPARTGHPFPTCFGCGPDRPPGESVHALLGPMPGRPGLWAGVWCPGDLLPSRDGSVAPEMAWVALDCSSAQPVAPDDGPAHVLGTLTARLDGPVRLDTDHVLLAWALGSEGRKKHSAAAIVGPDGAVRARARAVWIALG